MEQIVQGGSFKPGTDKVVHDHTCARTVQGRVLCWGSNSMGQLGRGSTKYSNKLEAKFKSSSGLNWLPSLLATLNHPSGYHRSQVVDLGVSRPALFIAAGGMHSCAIVGDILPGKLVCWGSNEYGQCGVAKQKDGPDEGHRQAWRMCHSCASQVAGP